MLNVIQPVKEQESVPPASSFFLSQENPSSWFTRGVDMAWHLCRRNTVCTDGRQLPHSLALSEGGCGDLRLCLPFPARLVQGKSLIKNSIGREAQYKQCFFFFF